MMYDTEKINEAIEQQELTNEKLAVKADLSSSTISAIRNGEENVRLTSLKKTAIALGFDVEVRFIPKPDTSAIVQAQM
ncbi:MAG TPA: helix-turn-helix transcriptional regulator [Pyrinomonadaceae bacterium]|nr:helix-turn-helix transcriptional regulator [Pyrinomonadaceae bacterium]